MIEVWKEVRVVEWCDAHGGEMVDPLADPDIDLKVMQTIGFVVKETDEYVTLAQGLMNPEGSWVRMWISIPKKMILKQTTMTKAPSRKKKK